MQTPLSVSQEARRAVSSNAFDLKFEIASNMNTVGKVFLDTAPRNPKGESDAKSLPNGITTT